MYYCCYCIVIVVDGGKSSQDGLLLYLTYSGLINSKLLSTIKTSVDILMRNAGTHSQQVMIMHGYMVYKCKKSKILCTII